MDLTRKALQPRVIDCLMKLSKEIAEEMVKEYPNCTFDCGMGAINIYNKDGQEVGVQDMSDLWYAQYGVKQLKAHLNVESFLPKK